jgi:hypothetical protein
MTRPDTSADRLPPPAVPYTYAAEQAAAGPVPSRGAGRWSAKRTAATAGITIVLVSAGAIGAAAALPAGGVDAPTRGGAPGGRPFPGHRQFGPAPQQGQVPHVQGQLPQALQNWAPQDGAQLPTLPDLTLDPTTRRT